MAAPYAGFTLIDGAIPLEQPLDHQDPLERRAADTEKKVDSAYLQIVLLDQKIRDLKTLYQLAVANNNFAFLDYIRMKLFMARSKRMIYLDYANALVAEMDRILAQMVEELF